MIVLELPLPPSVNGYKRLAPNGHPYTTAKTKAWRSEAGWIVAAAKPKHSLPIRGEISVALEIERKGDIDNRVKPLLDLLQEMGVFDNDSQVVELHVRFAARTGVKVTIAPV